MKVSDNDLFRLQDGEPPKIINPDWDIETVITSMAVELLELRSEVEQRWISVKDRLPDSGVEVLCITESGEYFLEYIAVKPQEDWTGLNPKDFKRHFIHWMPLPEPPEEV